MYITYTMWTRRSTSQQTAISLRNSKRCKWTNERLSVSSRQTRMIHCSRGRRKTTRDDNAFYRACTRQCACDTAVIPALVKYVINSKQSSEHIIIGRLGVCQKRHPARKNLTLEISEVYLARPVEVPHDDHKDYAALRQQPSVGVLGPWCWYRTIISSSSISDWQRFGLL